MANKKNDVLEAAESEQMTTNEQTAPVEQASLTEGVVDPNELVTVELFKDDGKYKDDVFVAVNGKTFRVKRGEPVKVPRYVKEVLDNAARQNRVANRYMETQQENFEKGLNEYKM